MRGSWPLALALMIALGSPAMAVDTIYLRDGRILRCQIVDQARESVTYERWGYRYTLDKRSIEWLSPPPAALVALGGVLVPGGGQLLLGQTEAGLATLGVAALTAGLTYYATYNWITRYDRPTSIAAGLGVAMIPWLSTAFQATTEAWHLGVHPPLRIERDLHGYRREVGALLAP